MSVLVMGTVAFDVVGAVARLPERDSTARVESLAEAPGGAAGNVALALARLGVPASLMAVVGEDFAGSAYERSLAAAGVDLSRLARVPGLTARAFMFSDPSGSQHVYFHPGASHASEALGAPVAARVGHFAAGDVRAYPPHMRACDVVAFDPGQETFHRDLRDLEACFPLVDLLFVNHHELARLERVGGWTRERLFGVGVGCVVESRGADGAIVHRPELPPLRVPAVPARLLDPTGAGDGHRAGFLAALERGAGVEDAARFGAVVASFVVESAGPQTSLPDMKAVEARYREAFGGWPL